MTRFPMMLVAFLLLAGTDLRGESLVFPPYLHSYGIRKATKAHLFMFFGPRTFFDNPQGLATARLTSWDDPSTDEDDDEVVVYGVNAGRHQIIYNTSMWSLGLYGGKGTGEDCLLHPRGIAADGRGNVYVADSGNNRVVRLFNPKSRLGWQGSFNGAGEDEPGLRGPSRIALDEAGLIYVTDPGNRRLVVFDSAGNVVRKIPREGDEWRFEDGPTALAVADGRSRWSYYGGERSIYCADRNGTRLWKLSLDGTMISRAAMPQGHSASYGAIDYYHSFWVTDTRSHCILKFDHDLKLLDTFGSRGTGDNQFIEPRGIAIYKRYGQTFVAEKSGAQYFWIGTKLVDAVLTKRGPGLYTVTLTMTERANVKLFSALGTDTLHYLRRFQVPPGPAVINFKAKEPMREEGLTLRLEATYSSRTYDSWSYPISLTR